MASGTRLVAYDVAPSSDSSSDDDDAEIIVEPGGAVGSTGLNEQWAHIFTAPRRSQQQEKAKKKRDEIREKEVAAAVATPTPPARAAHIDKTRVVRNHAEQRAQARSRWEMEREQEEEEEEEEEEEDSDGDAVVVRKDAKGRKRRKRGYGARGPKKSAVASRARCKTVSIHDRIKQFPDQTLISDRGQLMCEACGRKPLCMTKQTVKLHCRGVIHVNAVKKFNRNKAAKQTSLEMHQSYSEARGGSYGSTLAPKDILGQVLVTKGCLAAGVPLHALNNPVMKQAFSHFGVRLPAATHLAHHIPFVVAEEEKKILEELGDSNFSVTFDGTPFRCECFGVGVRFIGGDGKIYQRLLSLSMLAKNMDFKDIFGEVHNILFKKFDMEPARCRGFMLDGCAANMKALMALTTHCANAVGMRCMSHLLNNAGDQIESEQIDKFAGALQTLLSLSHNAKDQWRTATGDAGLKAPSHRWASHYERSNQLVTVWEHMKDFLGVFTTKDETRSAKAKFCREELARLGQYGYHQEFWLKLEFALAVDLGVHLTKATYLLEGDGMLLPVAFDAIMSVRKGLALTRSADDTFGKPHLPNVDATIREYCVTDAEMIARSQAQARENMRAVQEYAWERIGDHPGAEQRENIEIYKAARLLNFRYVKQHQLSATDINLLLDPFPFITDEVISSLVGEKEEYHLAASVVDTMYDLWNFWRDNETRLPHWYKVAKDVALIQPSSAFMERVFSILRACMDERQESSFSDRIGAAALLKYNRGGLD